MGAGSSPNAFQEIYQDFNGYYASADYTGLRFTIVSSCPNSQKGDGAGSWTFGPSGDDADAAMVATGEFIRPDRGGEVVAWARYRTTLVNKSAICFALCDNSTYTTAVIFENEDGSINSSPADGVGILLEGEQSLALKGLAVKSNADSPLIDLGIDIVANEFVMVGLEVNADGDVWFVVDGKRIGDRHEKLIDPTKTYAAAWSIDDRGTGYAADLDEICARAPRPL